MLILKSQFPAGATVGVEFAPAPHVCGVSAARIPPTCQHAHVRWGGRLHLSECGCVSAPLSRAGAPRVP